MDSLHRTTWWIVSIIILALVTGYVGFLYVRDGASAFTGAVSCPAPKQVCQGGNCAQNPTCASGNCTKDCPGNCPHSQRPV